MLRGIQRWLSAVIFSGSQRLANPSTYFHLNQVKAPGRRNWPGHRVDIRGGAETTTINSFEMVAGGSTKEMYN